MHYQRCPVPGCSNPPASGHSPLCNNHRRIQYRHGHPLAVGVTVNELLPYRKRVAAIRRANPTSAVWRTLEANWSQVVANAGGVIHQRDSGAAYIRHHYQAACHLRATAAEVGAADVVETALAMFMLAHSNPHRFHSPRAFDHALVRRVRGLASSSTGSHWNHKTQRMKLVYRDMPPRTVQALAAPLRAVFTRSGLQLAEMERSRVDEAQRLQDAVAALRLP